MTKKDAIKLFESKKIRVPWDENEGKWYFSITDIIESLTRSRNPRQYWSDLKRKLKKEGSDQLYEFIVQLKLIAPDGKKSINRLCCYKKYFTNNTICVGCEPSEGSFSDLQMRLLFDLRPSV